MQCVWLYVYASILHKVGECFVLRRLRKPFLLYLIFLVLVHIKYILNCKQKYLKKKV